MPKDRVSEPPAAKPADKRTCGVVMPISEIDGCSEAHWLDVKEIVFETIESIDFEASLVSEADEVGIIQKRIIQNLYENPVVVCDVSGKNPNVMFELGIRLAFDKPTIIIKDDKTSYSFDTAPIEHIEYPRDLRFARIVAFKEELADKIQATHQRATTDKNYTTFLKHFGPFIVPTIETHEVPRDAFILNELQSLRKAIGELATRKTSVVASMPAQKKTLCLLSCSSEESDNVMEQVAKIEDIGVVRAVKQSNGHTHFPLPDVDPLRRTKALLAARKIVPKARLI